VSADREPLVKRLRDTASKGVSAWGDLQLEAAKEIEILTAERELYASAMDKMKAAQPAPVNAELWDACKEFCQLYGHLWDRADIAGAGFLSPESVEKYDAVHSRIEAALANAKPERELSVEQIEAALKAACMRSTPESRKDMRNGITAALSQSAPLPHPQQERKGGV
jgi:hypothetical protein